MHLYKYIVLYIFLNSVGLCLHAQTNTVLYLGTKTPYSPQQTRYTPAPKGYTPVFINHVGRHGSRFLTKPGSDVMVLDILTIAGKANALTPLGNKFKQMAEQFEDIERNSYENITLGGAAEQQGIGARLLKAYGSAFTGRGIDVLMTEKVRTQQSANGFLAAFSDYRGEIRKTIIPDSADYMLRFYDLSPGYQAYKRSDELKARQDSLENDPHTAAVARNICSKLFDSSFARLLLGAGIESAKKKKVNGITFTEGLYDIYAVQYVIKLEMAQKNYHIDFSPAFTAKDLQWLDKLNNAADFFEKGPATDAMGIQVAIAAPLLADFLTALDDFTSGKLNTDAKLRFTHAEAIFPFATLLGIPQTSKTSSSVYTYHKNWKASAIIPMSANIQWVLYSNGSDYLLKALLNEKEVKLPVKTNSFPYYKLSDVTSYYKKVLIDARQKW